MRMREIAYIYSLSTYGSSKKYRFSKSLLRSIWLLFWLIIPIPVVTAVIGGLGSKLFKRDILFIRRFE